MDLAPVGKLAVGSTFNLGTHFHEASSFGMGFFVSGLRRGRGGGTAEGVRG